MGHLWLGTLPATRRWRDVIGLIADGADVSRVAEATAHAWQRAFETVRNDAGFREAVWLLTQLGAAGRSEDPGTILSAAGLDVAGSSSVVEVAIALSTAMDARIEGSRHRSDFGELAQRALVATVTEQFQREMSPLIPSSADDIRAAVRQCGKEKTFGALSRGFYARLTNECLNYFLSKTLSAQVGEKRQFATTAQLAQFEDAMRTHCVEAAGIVEDYSAGWFSKHYRDGGGVIGREDADHFGWYGLVKMHHELAARARNDGN
jgi:hypothetical protein